MWNLKIIPIIVALALPHAATAGPFGLEMGMSHEIVTKGGIEYKPTYFVVLDVPKKTKMFDHGFVIRSTPTTGLCSVKALSQRKTSENIEADLRSAFNDLVATLSLKYGPPTNVVDSIDAKSKLKQPHQFAMSLHKKERTLSSLWHEVSSKLLPNDVQLIHVGVDSDDGKTGHIWVNYMFSNFSQCERAAAAEELDVL